MMAVDTSPAAEAKAAKRFNQLPPAVRSLLAEMRDEDVDALKWMIDLHRSVSGWCRVNRWLFRWLFVGVVTALIVTLNAIEWAKDALHAALRFFGKA